MISLKIWQRFTSSADLTKYSMAECSDMIILLQFAEERHLGKVVNDMAAADKKKDIQEVHGDAIEILKATMLYDLYARENLKSRPEWAHEILYRPLC